MFGDAGILAAAGYLAAGWLAGALIASVLRRWRLAANLAGLATFWGLFLCVVLVTRVVAAYRSATEPAQKAVVLSVGVSEAMNIGALALIVVVVSTAVWLVARRRSSRAS